MLSHLPTTAIAVSSTTLPKVSLSYKWIINDAKLLIDYVRRDPCYSRIQRSEPFSVLLPSSKTTTGSQNSSWHLAVSNANQEYRSVGYFSISLCQGDPLSKEKAPYNSTTVTIPKCVFNIVNLETGELFCSKHAHGSGCCTCTIGNWLETCCASSIEWSKIDNYLVDGTLTIQVEASLHCYTDVVNTLDVISDVTTEVPPDDIRDKMHTLYKGKVLTDVTIKCQGKEFKVHRAVLASQSVVFKTMFEVDMEEKNSCIVNISDILPAVISDLVSYLYTGTAPNLSTLAKELLNAANKYEISRLFAMCERELKMRIEVANVVDTLILADLHGAAKLKQACFNFTHLNSTEVHKTRKWRSLKDQYGTLLVDALVHAHSMKTQHL